MPTAKTIHTPGCLYSVWTDGVVQNFKLFSMMTTLRAYLSFEGREHFWIFITLLMLCPFAAQLSSSKSKVLLENFTACQINVQNTASSLVESSIYVRGKKMKLLLQCERVVNLQVEHSTRLGPSPSPWLWHVEGSRGASGQPPHSALHSPSPLPATKTVDSQEEKSHFEVFCSCLATTTKPQDISVNGTPTFQHAEHEEHTTSAPGWLQPQQQHVPPHLSNLLPAAAFLHIPKTIERHSKAPMCWWWQDF